MKKLHPIVMLPTEKSNLIACDDGTLFYYHKEQTGGGIAQCQHLYILSDEEIKEGDWCIRDGWDLFQADKWIINALKTGDLRKHQIKKVIATTDKSLTKEHDDTVPFPKTRPTGIKLIPKSFLPIFVKAYNEGNPITEVELECKYYTNGKISILDRILQLKTTESNEVIIHLPKEKMYSREVLKSMFRKIFIEGGKCARNFEYDFDIDKWIEENL